MCIVAGFDRHSKYVLYTSLGQMSVVGKLFPHKKFVHNLPETLTNHDWLFICRKFKSSQGRCQPFTYQEVFNASEYPTCMQQPAISKANAYEYLVAA